MKLRQKSKKPFIIGSIAASVLVVAGMSYYVFALNGSVFGWHFKGTSTPASQTNAPGSSTINMDAPTSEEKQSSASIKEQTVENAKNSDTSSPTSLTVSFTSAAQTGDTLRVRAKIDQLISTGTCTLTLTKDTKTVTKTASVYASASITTCQGFDIPISELSAGAWSVKLTVANSTASGEASTTATIE